MSKVNGHTSEQVIIAIREARGNLTEAARILGVARMTVYRYCKRYSTIQQALDDEREKWIDTAEQKLMKSVEKGSIPAIIFFLKTMGKSRGYVERQEVTGKDGEGLKIEVEYVNDPAQITGLSSGSSQD